MRTFPKRKTLKPSEYPDQILKALLNAYDDPDNAKAREEGIGFLEILQLAGMTKEYAAYDISTQEIYEYLRQLSASGYIYESSRANGQPLYKPTPKGLDYGRFLNRSWFYRKCVHPIKGDIRTVVFALITAIIVTIVITVILKAIGW